MGRLSVGIETDEVVDEVRPLVAAGLRHVVIWYIGPLATGARPIDLLRLALRIRRLKTLSTPAAS